MRRNAIEKNKKVSKIEPIIDEVRGATNHFFLSLSKTWTSKFCAIKNATPEPIAILKEIISSKLVDIIKVNNIPITKPVIYYFSCYNFTISSIC